jgi:uncharacterized protein (TIGR00369 family)
VTDVARRVERVKDRYEDCFGCGRANAIGLQLDDFSIEDGTVVASFRPRPEYRGFEGVLHGGIVAAALDELLGWTAILLADAMAVTAKLELRYRRPAPAGGEYRLEGRVVDRRGKRLVLSATCSVEGDVVAEASGVFLATGKVPSD